MAYDSGKNRWLVSRNPTGGAKAWKPAQFTLRANGPVGDDGIDFHNAACPSASLCLVAAAHGVFVSRDPTGGLGVWKLVKLPGAFFPSALTCVRGSSLCLLADVSDAVHPLRSMMWSTTRPRAGAAAWRGHRVNGTMDGDLVCAARSLCLEYAGHQDAVSTRPLGGPWRAVQLPGPLAHNHFISMACPSATRCIGFTVEGATYVSDDPAQGVLSWRLSSPLGPGGGQLDAAGYSAFAGVAVTATCPSPNLCVVGGDYGTTLLPDGSFPSAFWTTTDPLDPMPIWTVHRS